MRSGTMSGMHSCPLGGKRITKSRVLLAFDERGSTGHRR